MPANVRALSVKENPSHHPTAGSCVYPTGRSDMLLILRIFVGKIPVLYPLIGDNAGLELAQDKQG